MATEANSNHRHVLILGKILFIIGSIILITGIVIGIATTISFAQDQHLSNVSVHILLLEILASFVVGTIFCFALAAALTLSYPSRRLSQGEESQRTSSNFSAFNSLDAASPRFDETPPHPVPAAASVAALKDEKHDSNDISRTQMLELLQQIRDVSLMNDSQLQHVAARLWTKRKEHLPPSKSNATCSPAIGPPPKPASTNSRRLLPDDEEVKQLGERISEEHALRLDEDLKVARAQIKQLYKINAWQEAEEIVDGLQHKYPHDREVDELTREVENKKEEVERELREHLLSNVTDATGKHDWPRGVAALEEFLQRFPTDTLSDRLRVDLLTLRENAGAQERKEQEALFKDLLKQHEYEKGRRTGESPRSTNTPPPPPPHN